eukprot:COSAG01_NODE_3997_length_5448_cov_1.814919_3_plen_165_part_00
MAGRTSTSSRLSRRLSGSAAWAHSACWQNSSSGGSSSSSSILLTPLRRCTMATTRVAAAASPPFSREAPGFGGEAGWALPDRGCPVSCGPAAVGRCSGRCSRLLGQFRSRSRSFGGCTRCTDAQQIEDARPAAQQAAACRQSRQSTAQQQECKNPSGIAVMMQG